MKRSKHSLSNYKLLSMDMGELVPVGLNEVLPGDSFQHSSSALIRVSPLLAPVMHPVHVRIHHWFVPHRLVWEDWESFITGGPDGMDASEFPTITIGSTAKGDIGNLADYLGVAPYESGDTLPVSALPIRGYDLIWNEWYRDQDLQDELTIDLTSGPDTTSAAFLQNVAWEKDRFTSSRPWTQKGPEVTIPLSGDAPVTGIGNADQAYSTQNAYQTGGSGVQSGQYASGVRIEEDPDNTGFPGVFADLSGVSAANINELRLAFALQRYEEARARYGSRYTEYLRYLGVRSSDARLQRPEYLGGGRQTIQFSEVLQTAEGSSPVGELRGHGIAGIRSRRYRRFFEEHGYVFTLMSVLPKTIYVQGTPRTWHRRTKEDFWQKELEHIGQEAIQNQEIYRSTDSADFTGTFGYQDRYDDYRREPSTVHGEFRTTDLDFWHMGRIFSAQPTLNADFVKSNPTKRINAVTTNDVLWCMINHSIQARRMVSKTGNSYIF